MPTASIHIRGRPHRRVALPLLLIFAIMLPYGMYLTQDLKRVIRSLSGYEGGKDSISKLPYFQDEKTTTARMSHNPHLKAHLLPWRILPQGSYQYEDPEFGVLNQPFAYAADIAARIPIFTESIYILGDGDNLGSGIINISEDEDGVLPHNKLQVNLRIYSNTQQMIRSTNVTYVQSHQGGIGIKVNTPFLPKEGATRRFMVIDVKLPQSTSSVPLQLLNFRTHLPNFVHTVGDLSSKVNFKSIALSSSNQPIYVQSLSANRARLRTTNSPVEGTFIASESLSLRSSNAPINADVKLSNDGKDTSSVEVFSSNEEVRLRLALTSSSTDGTGGNFRALAKTSNKAIDVICPIAPLYSLVQLEVQTSNAPATLRLPPAYEGNFRLRSTPYKPSVMLNDTVQDPYDLHRERAVTCIRERRGLMSGDIHWTESGDQDRKATAVSSVSVKTSNAETRVFL